MANVPNVPKTTFYNVDYLSNLWADKTMSKEVPEGQLEGVRTRTKYNFQVTVFNASTVLSVITVAAAFFLGSPLFALLALATMGIRHAFMTQLDFTLAQARGNQRNEENLIFLVAFRRLANVNPNEDPNNIREHFGIQNQDWEPVPKQLLNFRLWMSLIPKPEQAAPQVDRG